MIVKEISCERFAGLQDASIQLKPGMNLLLGDNESGKSTIADLMYHLFFRDVRIGRREAEDKAFSDTYFPKGLNAEGDIIDGSISFETENGSYKLSKEWSFSGSSCRLTLPDGTRISNEAEIKRILEELLEYGKGIFDEVIFPSQKRRQTLLAGLLSQQDRKKDAADPKLMQVLVSAVNKAVLETGGVSLEVLEAKLQEKISQYASRWDDAAQMPEGGRKRGLQNRWKNPGLVLEAYYALEAANELLKQTEEAEKATELISGQIRDARQRYREAQEEKEQFSAIQGLISNHENLKKLLDNARKQLSQMEQDAQKWPDAKRGKQAAEQLKQMLEEANLRALYGEISTWMDQKASLEAQINTLGRIQDSDVKQARHCASEIQSIQAKIKGINLTARLRKTGDAPVNITSAATDLPLDISGESFPITEAVVIDVPGIMKLELMPQGIDLEVLRLDLRTYQTQLKQILETHHVSTLNQLQENAEKSSRALMRLDSLSSQIAAKLNGTDYDELRTKAAAISPTLPSREQIRDEITSLCSSSIDIFLGRQDFLLRDFESLYGTPEGLAKKLDEQKAQVLFYQKKLDNMQDIPAQYRQITDADSHYLTLKQNADRLEDLLHGLEEKLRRSQLSADAPSAEDCRESCRHLAEAFEAEKAQLYHWQHIYTVFQDLKEQEKEDPTRDISDHFREYLSLLSDDSLRLEAMDDKLQAALVSGNARLTYGILSEGTKDTIALAFRLAMLEHLYPQGGATVVFDDPFTDMDPRRTRQACLLLQRFALRNQVLFISCDEKYLPLLPGNVLFLSGRGKKVC